jgi:hypothetical protein
MIFDLDIEGGEVKIEGSKDSQSGNEGKSL